MSSTAQRFQPRVRILYEDSRASTNGFGLHDYVLANVRDVILERGQDVELFRLRKLIDAAQPGTFESATLDDALGKDPTARDLCFKEAALAKHVAWRKLVRDGDPSFDDTIRYLADLTCRERWPPW